MPRNKSFHNSHEPFREYNSIELVDDHINGPFRFLNPTRAHFKHTALTKKSTSTAQGSDTGKTELPKTQDPAPYLRFKWRSRDNRKGRHALAIPPSAAAASENYVTPKPTSTLHEAGKGILRMLIQYPYWDISYLVATIFTLGSVVWVMNAFFVFLPLVQPGTEFGTEIEYGGGITAFIGATIFEIGSVLLMFEAINENRSGCFGWALERLVEGEEEGQEGAIRVRPDKDRCAHHHTNKRNLVGKSDVKPPQSPSPNSTTTTISLLTDLTPSSEPTHKPPQSSSPHQPRSWKWYPSQHDLTTYYLHDLGFLASLSQFLGASIFWLSGLTALPGINTILSQNALDGIYWAPQIVGGTGFIISGTLFMLETQTIWYVPAPGVLGWHIGFWNLVGAYGFTLCGALGPAYASSGAQYEASLATFWGSWAFLIGSLIQWYESLDKYPVEVEDTG
ncbi:MAG: hypothetical protein Q9191_003387 [Dirinaria sp. TL-2023a]